MRALNVLLAVLISLALGIAVFELGLRLVPAFSPPQTMNHFDPAAGWSKEPGRAIERSIPGAEIRFVINEAGLRDDPGVGPAKEPGTYRVMMLGDSFVLGYTVEREDLFVDLLEGWWRSEERRVDVVNAGTEGWSTDQEAAWFLEHGQEYRPDLVLLFPYENDVYWNGQTSYFGKEKPRFTPDGELEPRTLQAPPEASWLASSSIVRFLQVGGERLRLALGQQTRGPYDVDVPGASGPVYGEFAVLLNDPPDFVADCAARTEGALIALQRGCRSVGAELVIVPIPSKSAIDPEEREFFRTNERGLDGLPDERWSPDRPVNLFLDLAREHGIEALDARAALAAAAADEKLYFPGDQEWHFNAAGNRAFARWLHDELDRREMLPAEHRARAAGAMPVAGGSVGGFPTFLLVFAALWALLGTGFVLSYPKEPRLKSFLSVGGLLAVIFTIVLGGGRLVRLIPHTWAPWIVLAFVVIVLAFVAWKLGRRLGTIFELLKSFTLRGHWYLMPLVVILLTIGSLLVVAASSPLIAPFIYTLV